MATSTFSYRTCGPGTALHGRGMSSAPAAATRAPKHFQRVRHSWARAARASGTHPWNVDCARRPHLPKNRNPLVLDSAGDALIAGWPGRRWRVEVEVVKYRHADMVKVESGRPKKTARAAWGCVMAQKTAGQGAGRSNGGKALP